MVANDNKQRRLGYFCLVCILFKCTVFSFKLGTYVMFCLETHCHFCNIRFTNYSENIPNEIIRIQSPMPNITYQVYSDMSNMTHDTCWAISTFPSWAHDITPSFLCVCVALSWVSYFVFYYVLLFVCKSLSFSIMTLLSFNVPLV